MQFKELTWKELKQDFKKILDKFTTKELVNSLEKYKKGNVRRNKTK